MAVLSNGPCQLDPRILIMRWEAAIVSLFLIAGCKKDSFEVLLPLSETARSFTTTQRLPMIYTGRFLDTLRVTGFDEFSEYTLSNSGVEGLKVERLYKSGKTLNWELTYDLEAIPIPNSVRRESDLVQIDLTFNGRSGSILMEDVLPFLPVDSLTNFMDSVNLRGSVFTDVLMNNGLSDDLPFYYKRGTGVVGWITPTDTFVLQQ